MVNPPLRPPPGGLEIIVLRRSSGGHS